LSNALVDLTMLSYKGDMLTLALRFIGTLAFFIGAVHRRRYDLRVTWQLFSCICFNWNCGCRVEIL